MALKLEGDLNILKMFPDTENEPDRLRHSKLKSLNLKKYENMSQGQNAIKSRSKCQKL